MICKICDKKILYNSPKWNKLGYNIYFCDKCGHKFVFPTPSKDELKDVYEREDYLQDCLIDRNENIFRKVRTQSEIDIIAQLRPKGNLLDCGSGDGMALYYAKKAGLYAIGVEMSQYMSIKSREKYGVQVFNTDFSDFKQPDYRFDVIRMKSVIEHLVDPGTYLKKSHDLLKEDGILIITTENYDSFDARKLGVSWNNISPPHHLAYFCPKSIYKILVDHGFKNVIIDSRGFPKYSLIFQNALIKYNPLFLYVGSLFHMNPIMTVYAAKSKKALEKMSDFKLNLKSINSLHVNFINYFISKLKK